MVGAKHTPICLPPACLLAPCLPARLCLYTRHPSRPSQRETLPCKLVNFACTSRTRKFHGVRIQRPSSVVPFLSPSPPSAVPPSSLPRPEQGNRPQFAGTSRSPVLTPVLAPRSEFQTLRLDLPLPLAVLFTSRRGYARCDSRESDRRASSLAPRACLECLSSPDDLPGETTSIDVYIIFPGRRLLKREPREISTRRYRDNSKVRKRDNARLYESHVLRWSALADLGLTREAPSVNPVWYGTLKARRRGE